MSPVGRRPRPAEIEYPRAVFGRLFADEPTRDDHLDIIEAVYVASMIPEEGETVPIGVVVDHDGHLEDVEDTDAQHDPYGDGRTWFVVRLRPIPLTPRALTRLAHGTEYGRDLVVVAKLETGLAMTGIARRRQHTDGGDALRIAAPRPGVIVFEGRNRQLGVRYVDGAMQPRDVDVLFEAGPVQTALRACGVAESAWSISEILRHARLARSGAMFLFLPTATAGTLTGLLNYPFADVGQVGALIAEERRLLLERVATANTGGHVAADQVEDHAVLEGDAARNRQDMYAVVEMVGRLSANDGAVVIEPRFHVAGAGFIIVDGPLAEDPPGPLVCADAAATNTGPRPAGGGARHTAGLRFAWSHAGSVVFIVSSDGPITCALRDGDRLLTWSMRVPET